MNFDVIIRGGNIDDGSGKSAYKADIGVKDDRIFAVGDLTAAAAAETIDATGLCVTPGFIDLHTHSDFTLMINGAAESQAYQGVTLEVIGQCDHSLAPVSDTDSANALIPDHFKGIEITWKSFGEYLSRLEQQELGVNVIAMVGQGTIRQVVMKDAWQPATPAETDQMVRLLEESLEAGAGGFSTGLEYWLGRSSTPEEIFPLCEVAARRNALYTTHVRDRDTYYDIGFAEALSLARNSGVKLQISHCNHGNTFYTSPTSHAREMIEQAKKS